MFKVTLADGRRVEIVAAHVVAVMEAANAEQTTTIAMANGENIAVTESARSIRGYVKKALAAKKSAASDQSEVAEAAE